MIMTSDTNKASQYIIRSDYGIEWGIETRGVAQVTGESLYFSDMLRSCAKEPVSVSEQGGVLV